MTTERSDTALNMEFIKPFSPKPTNNNIKVNRRRYYESHKEEIKKKNRDYSMQKYNTDPDFRARALARYAEYRKAMKLARQLMSSTMTPTMENN